MTKIDTSVNIVMNRLSWSKDFSIFAEKLKTIFTKSMVFTPNSAAFSQNLEKRAVQVCFFISACVDTVMQYLKGNLTKSLDTVAEVITKRSKN